MEKILDKFLRYVAVETTSDPDSETQPSSMRELSLLQMLHDELQSMGVESALDEYGYLMASVPSNTERDVPAIGFIAHVDTSPDAPAKNVRPQIVEDYSGGDIILNPETEMLLRPSDFPEMLN